jgi:hypothetical protein
MSVTITLSEEKVNELLNILNMPIQAPTVVLANWISYIQSEIARQLPDEETNNGE